MEIYMEKQTNKFNKFKISRDRFKLIEISKKYDYSLDKINAIQDCDIINKIQYFFRKYTLLNKKAFNDQSESVIKFRQDNLIYGFKWDMLLKYIDINGYINPLSKKYIDESQFYRIDKAITKYNPYKFKSLSQFISVNSNEFIKTEWEMNDILQLFENKGLQEINAPNYLYNKMLDAPPGLYCMEVIDNDPNNYKRSYVSFKSIPSENNIIDFPVNVYNQLGLKPNQENQFKMKLIKPMKATKIYLRSLLDIKEMVKDIKNIFTKEINIHKILSVGQIIIIESDINSNYIPFLVEKCEPSNIVDTTNVDVEVDFLPAMNYDNTITSLLIELNK
tara:strand:+ start:2590 stop:3588 length:999 start_codon:yes stop_codon:yes gene_type:complete